MAYCNLFGESLTDDILVNPISGSAGVFRIHKKSVVECRAFKYDINACHVSF